MPLFRKKPVVVEARRFGNPDSGFNTWSGEQMHDLCRWCGGVGVPEKHDRVLTWRDWTIRLHTLEGPVNASFGDFIVKGVAGEFYPIRSDIFRATYEPAE